MVDKFWQLIPLTWYFCMSDCNSIEVKQWWPLRKKWNCIIKRILHKIVYLAKKLIITGYSECYWNESIEFRNCHTELKAASKYFPLILNSLFILREMQSYATYIIKPPKGNRDQTSCACVHCPNWMIFRRVKSGGSPICQKC